MTGPAGRAPHVAVVGGGVSGLAAAHRLRTLLGPSARITVLEQRDRLGGVLRTVDLAGVAFDVGAEAFLARRPEVPALLDELGLAQLRVHPGAATATIRAGGRTVAMPAGTLLGVPTSRARLDDVLSGAGLDAVRAEPGRALRWERGSDVALGALLRERFGDEVADRVADPLLGGVYAGRVDTLGLRATVPALAAALDAGADSLTAAATAGADATPSPGRARTVPPAGPVFGAVRGGYRVLLSALADASAAQIRLGTTVRSLEHRPGGWRVVLGPVPEPEVLDVDAVVLAVPAPALRRLLDPVVPAGGSAAAGVELASSVVVALAYRAVDVAAMPSTSGCLIAADEPLSVKGVTHSSTKWGHLAPDATDDLVRLRVSMGRFGEASTLQVDDEELVRRARADLRVLDGIDADPVAVHVQRWGGGLPQYGVGHLDRVAALESAVAGVAGLAVAGSALHGVGVPACVGTARAAAEQIVAGLSAAAPTSTS
ncbi:protoporphyrinogen oxidase [Pseudonocardia sp. KRD291]|uniref:protoporphyrinogen oxidase n=1 Tax=Pseudonocardia sp. KRD291 TaxID=2792007 RepID=UPI001C4A007D|nr:protoporphyrinogen oxidase [Pseudonocardia sp. KRD291]MBW0104340.1 protoporphyrinogen oxidase [Pseudonocardia sp. KRD291]